MSERQKHLLSVMRIRLERPNLDRERFHLMDALIQLEATLREETPATPGKESKP